MFIVLLKYIRPLEEVDAFLAAHVRFLDDQYEQGKFIFSGRRNPRIGGVILVNVNSEKELEDIVGKDPFYINKVAEYEIIEFTPTKFDPKFNIFINNGE